MCIVQLLKKEIQFVARVQSSVWFHLDSEEYNESRREAGFSQRK